MLRLKDFVTGKKDNIIRVGGVYSTFLEYCRKMKFRTYFHVTLRGKIFYVVMVEYFCGL